jgi:hypothetical protein
MVRACISSLTSCFTLLISSSFSTFGSATARKNKKTAVVHSVGGGGGHWSKLEQL